MEERREKKTEGTTPALCRGTLVKKRRREKYSCKNPAQRTCDILLKFSGLYTLISTILPAQQPQVIHFFIHHSLTTSEVHVIILNTD